VDRRLGQRLAGVAVDLLVELALELARLLDMEFREVLVAGGRLELLNGRGRLVCARYGEPLRLLEKGEITTLDPLVFSGGVYAREFTSCCN